MLKDYLHEYVAKNGFKHYTELRAHTNSVKAAGFLNSNLIANTKQVVGGVSARVYNGAYGFASTPIYNAETIGEMVKAAERNAELLTSKQNITEKRFTPVTAFEQGLCYEKEDAATQKELIDYIAVIDSYIKEKYPKLASRFIQARADSTEKMFINADNVFSHSYTPRSLILIGLTYVGADGAPVDLMDIQGGFGIFAENFKDPTSHFEAIDKLYEKVVQKSEGVYAEAGIKECILNSDLTGILAHEAVGHTVEADFVMAGSVAKHYLNKEVASEKVTLIDYAHTALGQTCPVPVYVDDEGTKAQDALIIENGILKGYMHNKYSAELFGVAPTGNARAYSFSDEPLIRMRNTAILPGNDKLEDMIASIDDGYYFTDTGNGQADATGEFMFGVNMGYEIKKGKLGRAIKNTTISGMAFDMLKTVSMVSDDMKWTAAGMCGKKQPISVGMGGASLKCKINVGGR